MGQRVAVLVTGAAGFIGWKVCEFLLTHPELIPEDLDRNATIVGIDNMNDHIENPSTVCSAISSQFSKPTTIRIDDITDRNVHKATTARI